MAVYKIWLSPVTNSRGEFVTDENYFAVPLFTVVIKRAQHRIAVC